MLFVDRLPKKLLKFLEQHLPPGMVDGEHCYSLALINMGIGREIVLTAKISCSSNSSYVDIFRGVRMNIEKIFKNMKVCVSCNPIFWFLIVASSSKYSFVMCLARGLGKSPKRSRANVH
jgi:hypothetical protein